MTLLLAAIGCADSVVAARRSDQYIHLCLS